jgi:hypothetical protein
MSVVAWTRMLRATEKVLVGAVLAIVTRTAPVETPRARTSGPRARPVEDVTGLIYELLDAHYDTARLASELGADTRWAHHLEYLSDLQRVAREALAAMPQEPVA